MTRTFRERTGRIDGQEGLFDQDSEAVDGGRTAIDHVETAFFAIDAAFLAIDASANPIDEPSDLIDAPGIVVEGCGRFSDGRSPAVEPGGTLIDCSLWLVAGEVIDCRCAAFLLRVVGDSRRILVSLYEIISLDTNRSFPVKASLSSPTKERTTC